MVKCFGGSTNRSMVISSWVWMQQGYFRKGHLPDVGQNEEWGVRMQRSGGKLLLEIGTRHNRLPKYTLVMLADWDCIRIPWPSSQLHKNTQQQSANPWLVLSFWGSLICQSMITVIGQWQQVISDVDKIILLDFILKYQQFGSRLGKTHWTIMHKAWNSHKREHLHVNTIIANWGLPVCNKQIRIILPKHGLDSFTCTNDWYYLDYDYHG